MLEGTVNAYRRKIFVTFGAFAGKQTVLGGNFFLGAKLDKDQSVPTTTRYVWKPGFAGCSDSYHSNAASTSASAAASEKRR